MADWDRFLDDQLARGRAYFSREEALAALGLSPAAFTAALARRVRKGQVAVPKHGFCLILRPEDRSLGAPDPVRWIDPLMRHLQLDYRVGLLRAAAFHGSPHQAAMVLQLIVPRQIRALEIGRHRLEFIYQSPAAFSEVNREPWLARLKSESGYAKVSGVELILLDCARYFHRVGGINGLAQIVKDLGGLAEPAGLAVIAEHYENSCARRLGFLLEHMGHLRQAEALRPFARKAKSAVLLDPSVKHLSSVLPAMGEMQPAWRLVVNEQVVVDS